MLITLLFYIGHKMTYMKSDVEYENEVKKMFDNNKHI